MKTAILLLSISALWGVELRAATVSFSNIPATNVVKATDLLLLDSALGGTNYSTRTLTISNLANVVAAPVGTVVASGTPASTNTFFAPSDLTGTNAVPRAILAADIATSIVTGKQTNATLASLGGVTTNAPAIAAGSIAAFSSSNVLGAATSAQLSNAVGSSVFVPIGGGSMTGLLTQQVGGVVGFSTITGNPTLTVYGTNAASGSVKSGDLLMVDFGGGNSSGILTLRNSASNGIVAVELPDIVAGTAGNGHWGTRFGPTNTGSLTAEIDSSHNGMLTLRGVGFQKSTATNELAQWTMSTNGLWLSTYTGTIQYSPPTAGAFVIQKAISASNPAISLYHTGDSFSAFTMFQNGLMNWGPGGSSARDTTFGRISNNVVAASGQINATNGFAVGATGGISTTWTNMISGVITQRITTIGGIVVTNLTL